MIAAEYINRDGFVTINRNAASIPGEGNGFLATGLAYACGLYTPPTDLIYRCRASATCPLIWRSPWKRNADDDQQADDYYGALLLDPVWAKELLEFAETNDWDFSMHPEDHGRLEYRFDRFLHFPAFVRLCAGSSLSLLDKAILSVTMLIDAFSIGFADANMRAFCLQHAAAPVVPFGELLASLWRSRVRKKYGRLGLAWVAYFGPEHPLSQWDGEGV